MKKLFSQCLCALLALTVLGLAPLAAHAGGFYSDRLRGWSAAEGYQYVLFGRYDQDYGGQPILWRVLGVKNGKAFLLSELILDTMPFDEETNEWTDSALYWWLNHDFLWEAFGDAEEAALVSTDAGMVFIPSRAELCSPAYGFQKSPGVEDPNRSAGGSIHAYTDNLWVTNNDYSNYYLRSQANDTNVHLVTSMGRISLARVERKNVGVRPAVWVDISRLSLTEGTGTETDPFR